MSNADADVLAQVGRLLSPEGRADPYPLYRTLHGYGPVLPLDDRYVVVLGYAAADQVLRDPGFEVEDAEGHDAAWPEWREHAAMHAFLDSMLFANSPRHERLRRLVSRAFTARRIGALRPAVERLAASLCDRLAEQGDGGAPVDFMTEFAFLLPVTVIGELLGVPEPDRAWFRPRVGALTTVLEMTTDLAALAEADAAVLELNDYFRRLVDDRRRDPRADLIGDLVRRRDEGEDGLSDAELLGNVVLLLAAGFETTTNLLGNGLAVVLDQPSVRRGLLEHPDRPGGFVEEVLRYDSPVQLTSRRASRATQVAGVGLPPGTSALVLAGAANRDPHRFADPDRFDPARRDNQPLSFGAGAHYCLGAALARLEAEVAFPMLLSRFPQLERAGAATRRDRLTLRGFATLPVRTA